MSKQQGLNQCIAPESDNVSNWHNRLIALEGMMAQSFATVIKTNGPLVTPVAKNRRRFQRYITTFEDTV
jgi:hypothetical protein